MLMLLLLLVLLQPHFHVYLYAKPFVEWATRNALLKVMLRTYFDLEFLMYAQLMIRLNGSFFEVRGVNGLKKC